MKILRFITGPLSVNTYVVYDETTNEGFVVDPGDYSTKIRDAINENTIALKYIILTHGHGDHIGGVEKLQKDFPDAIIVANVKEKEMLENAQLNASEDIFGRAFTVSAQMFVNGGDKIKVGNIELQIINTPGHTAGGMSIYTEGVVFTGDTLFYHSVGRTDFYSGDPKAMRDSLVNKLFKLPDDTKVLPGHDAFSTIGNEKRENPFV